MFLQQIATTSGPYQHPMAPNPEAAAANTVVYMNAAHNMPATGMYYPYKVAPQLPGMPMMQPPPVASSQSGSSSSGPGGSSGQGTSSSGPSNTSSSGSGASGSGSGGGRSSSQAVEAQAQYHAPLQIVN